MKFHKRMISRILLGAEIFVFFWFYCFGVQGIRAVYALKAENDQLEQKLAQEHGALDHLNADVEEWQSSSFVKEKLAREQLQMAREHEEIYIR